MAIFDFGFSIPRGGIEGAIVPQAGKNKSKGKRQKSKGKNEEQFVVPACASGHSIFDFCLLPFDFAFGASGT